MHFGGPRIPIRVTEGAPHSSWGFSERAGTGGDYLEKASTTCDATISSRDSSSIRNFPLNMDVVEVQAEGTWGARTSVPKLHPHDARGSDCRPLNPPILVCSAEPTRGPNSRTLSKRSPRASPRVTALQAEKVRGGAKPHIPFSEKNRRIPPIERLGRFWGEAHSTLEAERLGSRDESPRRQAKSAKLKMSRPILLTSKGVPNPRNPKTSILRKKSSWPPMAAKAPLRIRAGISAFKNKAAKLPSEHAMPTVTSAAKTHATHPTIPKLKSGWGRVRLDSRRSQFPQ